MNPEGRAARGSGPVADVAPDLAPDPLGGDF